MPLRLTSAPVSGVQRKRKSTSTSTSQPRASIFTNHPRTKPRADNHDGSVKSNIDGEYGGLAGLPDLGLSRHISQTARVENVRQALRYIRDTMFEDLPTSRTGMNSTRVANVLSFRRSLPPLASVAHVHTLLDAPTQTEREIVDMVNSETVRRLFVPGRGNDAAGLGDCLVLAEDWENLVRENAALEAGVKEKFLKVLKGMGSSSAIPSGVFSAEEYRALLRAGLVVSSSSLAKGSLGVASLPSLPTTSAAASASRIDQPPPPPPPPPLSRQESGDDRFHTATLFLSLPNTGPYLRLLNAARNHLLSLLKKSPSREAPLYLIRDRWDGAVETDKSFHVAKRERGEYAGLLPGRTKKWKDLYGMRFRWVLEEALGAGLVEVFETGSVGPGLRCL